MRNLLLFILFLIGLYYVRRALRRPGAPGPQAGRQDDEGGPQQRGAPPAEIEQMVACLRCGLHVPESEGVRGAGGFYCSEEHRRLGPRG